MRLEELEGEVYLCEWTKIGKQFRIQVLAKPGWNGLGDSFAEAEADLLEKISEATGDMQPCFEYKPEPPKDAIQARFVGPGIVGVSGANDPTDADGDCGQLFTGGVCSVCRRGIGERTESPLKTTWKLPAKSDGAFVRVRLVGTCGSMTIQIFSAEFMKAISAEERRRFKWLPVEAAKKSKREFCEPISRPLVPTVMPKGLFREQDRLQPDGFQCENCGRKELAGIPQGGGGIYTFVSEADLPKPLPTSFHVGQNARLEFCMTRKRWEELAGTPGTCRLMSRQIGVVKRNWVNCDPKFEVLPKQESPTSTMRDC